MGDVSGEEVSDVYIDHLTILLTKEEFESLPDWLTDNFTILEGGNHTSKKSRIKIIAFEDGSYIELFSWIGSPPKDQPWGIKSPCLIDFALSVRVPSTGLSNWERINRNLSHDHGDGQLGVRYGELEDGGRKTPAGDELRWQTSRPEYHKDKNTPPDSYNPEGRIEAPFWCHDITERRLRTPFDDPAKTTHPSSAIGIRQIEVVVPSSLVPEYSRLYESVTGSKARQDSNSTADGVPKSAYSFELSSAVSSSSSRQILIQEPFRDSDHEWLRERGIGFNGFTIQVRGREGHSVEPLSPTGTGSRISLVW